MSLTSYRAAPPRDETIATKYHTTSFLNRKEINIIFVLIRRPGNDLLFHTLRCSTIGAEKFNGRVRDGIVFRPLAIITKLINNTYKQNIVFDGH